MYCTAIRIASLLVLGLTILPFTHAFAQDFQEGRIHLWVKKYYSGSESSLHSEFSINGQLIDSFSSNSMQPVEEHLKEGWNDLAIKTSLHEPANQKNHLIFRIGPIRRDTNNANRLIMDPIIWEFRNGTDWKFTDDGYTHRLGPEVREVALIYPLYWAGLPFEGLELKEGDYILQAEPYYCRSNSPVVATVSVNGTPLSSFFLPARQLVITPLLKPGNNDLALVTHRIQDSCQRNDIDISIAGPARWSPERNEYLFQTITSSKAMHGWTRDDSSCQMNNKGATDADFIERTISFMVKKKPPKKPGQSNKTAAMSTMTDNLGPTDTTNL